MKINGKTIAIFDVDGTLMDSMGLWPYAANTWLDQRNLKVDEDMEAYYRIHGLSKSCRYLSDALGLDLKKIEYEVSMTQKKAYETSVEPIPGAMDFLRKLKAKNIRMCVLTANYRELIIPALDRLGMKDFFDEIILTTEADVSKRDTSAFLYMANLMGSEKEDCIMFEDRPWSLKNALKAGMKAVGIYSDSTLSYKDGLLECTEFVVDDYCKLKVEFE